MKNLLPPILLIGVLCLLINQDSYAQSRAISYPHLSPLEKIEIQIGVVQLQLEYSRPSARGRTIFGELVPYNSIWRTGANKNTKLTFDRDIILQKDTLTAGAYTLFIRPNIDDWEVFIYPYIDYYGIPKNFAELEPSAVFHLQPKTLKDNVETMTFSFSNMSYGQADIELKWADQMISIPLRVPTTGLMNTLLAEQVRMLSEDYAMAARIYYSEAKLYDEALEYLDKCIEIRQQGTSLEEWIQQLPLEERSAPWAHQMKSEIYAHHKNYKAALKYAALSLQIAEKIDSDFYRKANNANIEKWKTKAGSD